LGLSIDGGAAVNQFILISADWYLGVVLKGNKQNFLFADVFFL
jgi:hypothetical protein